MSAGLTFYLNGYTGPRISDLELKRLIAVHGGNVRYVSFCYVQPQALTMALISSYLANSSCTHILITKNLSASKTQKFLDSASSIRGGKRKVVHVDCESRFTGKVLVRVLTMVYAVVLDSVAKCRRLDETPYNVIVNKVSVAFVQHSAVTLTDDWKKAQPTLLASLGVSKQGTPADNLKVKPSTKRPAHRQTEVIYVDD